MSKESLSPAQLNEAKQLDKSLRKLANIKDELKNYKLGDIFVLEEWFGDPNNAVVQETHMGFPSKFQVVHISTEGIPYLRKMTSSGNPTGEAFIPPEAVAINALRRFGMNLDNVCQRFVADPEQLDAILLQQEFDPMANHRDKSKLFNEINKHNKNATIPTGPSCYNKVADFFKASKPGDKFWTSPDKQYVIQSVVKQGKQWLITTTDQNQATVEFNISSFLFKRLYKEQPRSFSKESKT